MGLLGRDRFEAAMKAVLRPVDRGRLRIRFGDGDPEDMRAGLAEYAVGDGGYGKALEPDFKLPASSPMATSVALQYLIEAKAPEHWPEVVAAIHYLADGWDPDLPGWESVPPAIDDYPHAPWWTYQEPTSFPVNPGVEIVGYLCHFEELVSGTLLADATAAVAEAVDGLGSDVEMHDLLCWMRFARCAPSGLARRAVDRLRPAVIDLVATDPTEWDGYLPGPLWVAPTPTSPFHDLVADHVDAHLDHLIESQQADGSWAPTWSWGDDTNADWQQAGADWRSPVTVHALETLDAYGRIESE